MFIGETVRPRVVLPLMVAFAGIVLVVRGGAGPGGMGISRWALAGLGSAVLSGAAVTSLRVARRTEGSWPIFASLSIFGVVATAPFAAMNWNTPNLSDWVLLGLIGLFSIGAQLTMTHAYRWVENVTAGVISQLAVVISMVLGALWLGERPTSTTLLGSILTLSGVVGVMWISSIPHPSAFDEAAEQ